MKTMIKHWPSFITMLVLSSVAIVFIVIYAILNMWENAIGIFIAEILAIVCYFATHHAIPLKYNEKVIRYKKKEYSWSDVKITIVTMNKRRGGFVFNIAFGDSFMFGSDARRYLSTGFWARLTIDNLKTVVKYYQDRIMIVNKEGSSISVNDLLIDSQIKQIIDDNNSKYFDNLKQ